MKAAQQTLRHPPPPSPPPPPPKPSRRGSWYRGLGRIERFSFWLALVLLAAVVVGYGLHIAKGLNVAVIVLCALALLLLLPVLLYRWISRKVLWKVRNRLILTYLLMGLAPIVLFGTLSATALYLLAGQYSTSTALSDLDRSLVELSDETRSTAALRLADPADRKSPRTPQHTVAAPPTQEIPILALRNGAWASLLPAAPGTRASPFLGEAQPGWLHAPFRGVVAHDGHLYLSAVLNVQTEDGPVAVLGSKALDATLLSQVTQGLGKLYLFPNAADLNSDSTNANSIDVKFDSAQNQHAEDPENSSDDDVTSSGSTEAPAPKPAPAPRPAPAPPVPAQPVLPGSVQSAQKAASETEDFAAVRGGTLADSQYLLDAPVLFSSPLPVYSWHTGTRLPSLMWVLSRPHLLYRRLFASSADLGVIVRLTLISVAIVFALLELAAVVMAVGLSRTITRSVGDLYQGTRQIDAGNLDHRVRVARHDQLGDLARSFNGMAASISGLLIEQREKDRLLNELTIAQEVQNTLFPRSPVSTEGLQMHAVCVPAQSVGGDYFDFIFGKNQSICLALGDISGKGISAALLMSSLHSAVRAFSLTNEQGEEVPPSPARLLQDLNRHLFRSTQSARYATLFIACYDAEERVLTYSNGGHLPPIILSEDGGIRRLECGGPVVGLLDGLKYAEAKVKLEPGDLLVAFTDGITEPEQSLVEFGEQRLIDLIRRHRDQALPEIMAATLASLEAWIGEGEQPDDITLLLARQL